MERGLLGIAAGLVGGSLLGLGLRMALFVLGAALVRAIGAASLAWPANVAWLDPVYTRAAVRGLAELHLQALAVAGLPGEWLHRAWPGLFADPARAHWSAVRIVVEPGSPVLGRLMAATLAHAGVLGAGLLMVRRGLRGAAWLIYKIVHPAWVGPQDAQRERNAEAFSDWLIDTADAIHRVDPDHPVTYRSAEDAFVPWVVAALGRAGGGPRPWFVFGTNCYQDYLSKIVDNWPASGMPSALWVSEFAPGGMAVPDRPDGFQTMWGYVRRHPEWVLGGAVYAWTRNGPEGVDRNFGLTDDGVPVDGRSLDMLAALFHPE